MSKGSGLHGNYMIIEEIEIIVVVNIGSLRCTRHVFLLVPPPEQREGGGC